MKIKLKENIKKFVEMNPRDLIPYDNNARVHNIDAIADSIQKFGFKEIVCVDENNVIINGHGRVKASIKLGLEKIPVGICTDLTEEEKKAFRLLDNKVAELTEWDEEKLKSELKSIEDIDMSVFGEEIKELQQKEIVEDEVPTDNIPRRAKRGQIWKLGEHRLMCGDSTSKQDVEKLMNGEKADMVFTDPPYGMKKEKDGVLNDNLNFDDLLDFNKKWIPLSFEMLTDVGSWYCWGIDEPLMDIYSEILKPMAKKQQITFRNLITWDKGHGEGILCRFLRSYVVVDEKCLFIMKGVQGFNNNADNYFDGWEPVRLYLETEMNKCGGRKKWKEALGNGMGHHYFTKSQWQLPTKEAYERLQKFGCEYGAFKREYDELKREYYATRSFFDNTHDKMTNVWHFDRTSQEERKQTGGHATPKPIALCSRAIKSSSREHESVLDVFGGSGSTLIACEQLNRKCFMMELDEYYCDVIIQRWENLTGKKAEVIEE